MLESPDVPQRRLETQVRAAQAQLDLARNNLGYTRIVSAGDGMAGSVRSAPGIWALGTQVISGIPLPNIWVIANYKETQMTNVRTCALAQPPHIAPQTFIGSRT